VYSAISGEAVLRPVPALVPSTYVWDSATRNLRIILSAGEIQGTPAGFQGLIHSVSSQPSMPATNS
jgi:hypothetical protein